MKTQITGLISLLIMLISFSCKKEINTCDALQKVSSDNQSPASINSPIPVVLTTSYDFMIANDVNTGAELWRYLPPKDKFAAGPVINGNAMYFATTHSIFKVSVNDRNVIWEYNFNPGENCETKIMPLALCNNFVILVITASDSNKNRAWAKVIAIDSSAGNEGWVRNFTYQNASFRATAPAVYNGDIWIGLGTFLTAIHGSDGSLSGRRQITASGQYILPPCIDNGVVYTGTCKNEQDTVYAFDVNSGKLVWKTSLGDGFPGTYHTFLCTPTVFKGQLMINGHTKMVAFNASSGAKKWEYINPYITLDNDIMKPLSVADRYFGENFYIYTTNIDGSKIFVINNSGNQHIYASVGFNNTITSFAGPVAVQYPEDEFSHFVYALWGTNYRCNIANGTSGTVWTVNNSGTVISFVIFDNAGNVFYSSESGMQQ